MTPLIIALAFSGFALVSQTAAAEREHPRAAASLASLCPPGFAALQNSDTCVRVGGGVRAESIIDAPRTRSSARIGTQAGGHIQLDVRRQTEYGPVRAFIRVKSPRP